MNRVYLIAGGNMGDRFSYLEKARLAIENRVGEIIRASSIYETSAWGKTDQEAFLNQVFCIKTQLGAKQVLENCLAIEESLGRIRTVKMGPRTIDIDILFYNDEVINEPHLHIPHPHLQDRRFVLVPLTEIAANLLHPALKLSVRELLNHCPDQLDVKQIVPVD